MAFHIKIGPVSVCLQTLRDNVFHQHTFVDLQLVSKDRSVELVFQIRPIRESKRNQKSGIRETTLEHGIGHGKIIGPIDILERTNPVGEHRGIKPMDRLFILSPTRVRCGMRNHVPFVTACQFRRNVRKERLQVVAVFLTLLAHSILPEQQDPLLFRIRCAIVLAVDKGLHDLRHTAHQHVLSKRPHHALMQRSHRLFAVKVFSYERHRKCVCSRPQKLFEIKRMNLKRVLLGRNQDVFASFRHAGKRSGFQVVVASVFQKRLRACRACGKS